MAEAEVGDDVWGDDPTVIALEREVAARAGQGGRGVRALGTMGNLIAVRAQPGRATRSSSTRAHVAVHEQGAWRRWPAFRPTADRSGGVLEPELLERYLRDASDIHHARQSLVWAENTVGELGGPVYPQERLRG